MMLLNIRLSQREKFLLLLFFMTLTFYLFFRIEYKRIEEYFLKKTELEQKKASLSLLQNIYNDKSSIEAAMKLEIKKLPADDRISDYIIEVDSWAAAEEVTLISIKAGEIIEDAKNKVKILPVEVIGEGKRDSLIEFLKHVENHERLSRINNIKMEHLGESELWRVTVTVDLFYLTG